MAREYRVICALRDTDVPVAPALAFCADEAVNDRPFYVMEFVDGHVLRDVAGTEAVLGKAQRRAAGEQLIDVLAAIHQVDVDAVGLGDFARRDGYIERQLRRWHGQFGKSQEQAREIGVFRPVPLVDRVHKLLADRLPVQQGTAIVHGDYRLDNTIMSADGRIMAVLDWELCTLGDPLADVGTLVAYWAEDPGRRGPSSAVATMAQSAATGLPGFPSRAEIADRYAARSGRDLSELNFYVAFAYWKLACILEGVFVRYAANAMGTKASDADVLGPGVEDRARRALEALQA
jgi:aminoglycoside phosphotransferase (APT) family kinase protein